METYLCCSELFSHIVMQTCFWLFPIENCAEISGKIVPRFWEKNVENMETLHQTFGKTTKTEENCTTLLSKKCQEHNGSSEQEMTLGRSGIEHQASVDHR